jgi:mono/diheme cytochrome c family protein
MMFFPSFLSRFVLLPLLGIVLFSGCAAEHRSVKDKSLLERPVLDVQVVKEDFSFPSRPPRLSEGQKVFQQNCATCHTGKAMSSTRLWETRPIDTFLMLTRGDHAHPAFPKLSRDQRWEAVFYARHLAGETQYKTKDVAAVYGSNCMVCHGSSGKADGTLYTGHGPHELGMAPVKGAFDPPPADFHSYRRMYNRTNAQITQFITEGIYPSAMPSWKGRVDKDKGFVFDDVLIEDLVKYVRGFSFENDLSTAATSPTPATSGKKPDELSNLPLSRSMAQAEQANK